MNNKKKPDRSKLYQKNLETKKWQCKHCGECFINRPSLKTHKKEKHPELGWGKGWNKGKTKETCDFLRKQGETYKKRYAEGKIKNGMKGKHHSEETKKKLSESRKAWILANPDKSPYLVSHYTRGESYSEKYFREWMEKENIPFIAQQHLGTYRLDFLVGNIDLEIDGEQHWNDKKIVESDKKRNKYVEEQGLKVIRIRWSHYSKLSYDERHEFLERLKVALITNNELNDNFIIDEGKLKKIYGKCKACGNNILARNKKYCSRKCAGIALINFSKGRKIHKCQKIPKEYYTQLESDLKECNNNHSELARRYGVSSNAIAKRIKRGMELGFIKEYITNGIGYTRYSKKPKPKHSLEFYRNILEEYKTSSNNKLARKYNTSDTTIVYWRRQAEKLLNDTEHN